MSDKVGDGAACGVGWLRTWLLLSGFLAGWFLGGAWRPLDTLTPFEPAIARAAARSGVDPELLRAVILVESGGRSDARSSAGAIGLMQLMTETAGERAAAAGIPVQGDIAEQLLDPEFNIMVGAAQLAYLLSRFEQQPSIALAAYNAGPTRVAGWLSRYPELPALEVIERMASVETRRYVARVLRLDPNQRARGLGH